MLVPKTTLLDAKLDLARAIAKKIDPIVLHPEGAVHRRIQNIVEDALTDDGVYDALEEAYRRVEVLENKEQALHNILHALGIEWGDDPYAVIGRLKRIRTAAVNVYNSAYWVPDREVNAKELWSELRDAAELPPGESPQFTEKPPISVAHAMRRVAEAIHEESGPGSYQGSWIANIAMPILDQRDNLNLKDHKDCNKMAEILLRHFFNGSIEEFDRAISFEEPDATAQPAPIGWATPQPGTHLIDGNPYFELLPESIITENDRCLSPSGKLLPFSTQAIGQRVVRVYLGGSKAVRPWPEESTFIFKWKPGVGYEEQSVEQPTDKLENLVDVLESEMQKRTEVLSHLLRRAEPKTEKQVWIIGGNSYNRLEIGVDRFESGDVIRAYVPRYSHVSQFVTPIPRDHVGDTVCYEAFRPAVPTA